MPAAHDGDRVAGLHLTDVERGAHAGGDAAAQQREGRVGERAVEREGPRAADRDELRVGADPGDDRGAVGPVGDGTGGREEVLALVRAALAAPEADAALGRARHEDVVALADARDGGAGVLDHADRGVPDDRRQRAGQSSHPALVEAVGVAVGAGGHPDDDVVVLGRHGRDVLDLQRPAVFDEECGSHAAARCQKRC
jgi:hypothetical protein